MTPITRAFLYEAKRKDDFSLDRIVWSSFAARAFPLYLLIRLRCAKNYKAPESFAAFSVNKVVTVIRNHLEALSPMNPFTLARPDSNEGSMREP